MFIIIRKIACYTSFFMLLPCPTAPVSICASHSVTGSLEVRAYGAGGYEFCFGRGSVLLEGHPLPQPLLGRIQSSQPAQLGSEPKVCVLCSPDAIG
jgi:hypothetical protein